MYYYVSSCPIHGLIPNLTLLDRWVYEKDSDKMNEMLSNNLGGGGKCKKCGGYYPSLSYHESVCGKQNGNEIWPDGYITTDKNELLIGELKSAIDRSWENETPEQIIAIVINALYYRNKEIKELKDKLEDWEGSVKWVMDESCDANTKHCGCVPTLRKMVKELKDELVAAKELLNI